MIPTGETRLDNLMAELYADIATVALYNHPSTRGGNVGRASGKPSSRSPGRQQCLHTVNCVVSILQATIRDVRHELDIARPKDAGAAHRVVMADKSETAEMLRALYAVGDERETH